MGVRFLKVLAGLGLVVIGGSLFVIFTSSLNASQPDGAPIGVGEFLGFVLVVGMDLVFLIAALSGMKLAGLKRSTVGLLAIGAGASILLIGIWNQMHGPSLDKGPLSDNRIPVPPELNIAVYVVAGLCLAGGLMLTMRRRLRN